MVDLARIREILGTDSPYSDTELERVRSELYALARAFRRVAIEGGDLPTPPGIAAFAQLSADDRLAVEERAAIAQFDGDLTRQEAERFALFRHYQKGVN